MAHPSNDLRNVPAEELSAVTDFEPRPVARNIITSDAEEDYARNPPPVFMPLPNSWRQKIILTCDGGGIRGFASLLMIEQLMIYIGDIERSLDYQDIHDSIHTSSFKPSERPPGFTVRKTGLQGAHVHEYLPCHYFDYMIGTSTGGLIATMLSRWRMSVDETLQQYEIVGKKIFEYRRPSLYGWPKTKHSKKPLIRAIEDLADSRTPKNRELPGSAYHMFPAPPDLCKTAVVAIIRGKVNKTEEGVTKTQEGPYLFRSYRPNDLSPINPTDPPQNWGVDINHEIWKVCRATTAAPLYFESQVIGDDEYCDGGAGVNNPTLEALNEMRRLHRNCLKIVTSFGTGKPEPSSIFKGKSRHIGSAIAHAHRLLKTAKASLTDCEKTHEQVQSRYHSAQDTAGSFNYFRFNVSDGLGNVELNEWKEKRDDGNGGKCTTLEYIRSRTEKELRNSEVQAELFALAKSLVRQRRERARDDPDQWERFACCTTYKCLIEGCLRQSNPFTLRREMREHLRSAHSCDEVTLEEKVAECRTFPEFPAGPY